VSALHQSVSSIVPQPQCALQHAGVKGGQAVSVSEDHLGNRLRVPLVRLASVAAVLPMSFGQDAGNLQDRGALRARVHTERVPIAAGAFETPVGAAEPTADGERSFVALFRGRKRDPIDNLADRIEKHCGVRTLVTIHAGDDAHAHLR
jgi:hypothetical protein